MKVVGTSMEMWFSQLCGKDAIISGIAPEDEVIKQNFGYRGPQNDHIPLLRYNIRDWGRLILKRKRPAH